MLNSATQYGYGFTLCMGPRGASGLADSAIPMLLAAGKETQPEFSRAIRGLFFSHIAYDYSQTSATSRRTRTAISKQNGLPVMKISTLAIGITHRQTAGILGYVSGRK